jgi:F-type H+-transporting ATPase subunit epsilon
MGALFDVDILTHSKTVYSGRSSSLVAPGELGYLGILHDHTALITALIPGKITLKNESDQTITIISAGKGFMDVFKNHVTMLLDGAEIVK